MIETTKTLSSAKDSGNDAPNSTRAASPRLVNRPALSMVFLVGLLAGLPSAAPADPTADRIFSECTFTTGASTTKGTLNSALHISQQDLNLLLGGEVQASYILIYVRENPNDGQDLNNSPSFTGPILCTNEDTVDIVETTEGTEIPGSIDILGAEEASHLQYRPTGGMVADTEKRVCHTVASNTYCFNIQPQP